MKAKRVDSYVFVRDRSVNSHLCHIAKLFRDMGNGFAEYFQAVISHLPRQTVESHLQLARCKVEREQTRQHKDHTDTILGDLGNFCEDVFDRMKTDKNVRSLYEITNHTQQELLH